MRYVNLVVAACSASQDWRLYIVQEFADGGPLRKLYGHKSIWMGNGQVDLVRAAALMRAT